MKNIQKRLRAFAATAMMLCAIFPAFAYDFKVDGICYNITGESEVEVTSGTNNKDRYSGDVVIPSSVSHNGPTYSVTSIGKSAFYRCIKLTSVTIPNSVTSIGDGAFEDCSKLTSVTIPNSVKTIGIGAFARCSELTSITIPSSVTSIGVLVFDGCSGLTSITIPNSVTSIGDGAFTRCSSLTSITIPNSVKTIGIGAFEDCSSLTSVTLSNSITSIEKGVFYNCTGLTSITIPRLVTNIGELVFYGCTGLTRITSNADVPPTCGRNAFEEVDTKNCYLYVPDGSINAYSNADGWKDFLNIVKTNASSSIDDIVSDQGNKPTEYYNLNGMRVNNPHNGIYIKRQGSKAEKVLIK